MSVYRHQGKWKYDFWKNKFRHQEGGYPTKQEAKAAEAEARKNLKRMNLGFTVLCESRLKDLKARRTDQYFNENKKLIENLIVRWRDKKKITQEDIEEYLREASTHFVANKELRFIKALFNHGLERNMISENPGGKIKFFAVEKKKKYIPPAEDVEKVLAVATPNQRRYLLAIINSLARVREINNLKWTDNFDKYIVLRTRKAKNSDITERKIPKNRTLDEVIKATPKIGEYVFCHLSGKQKGERYDYRSKIMPSLCTKAKVRQFTFHNLRHFGASRLADMGVPVTDIQVLLGHTQPSTTNIYLQSIKPNLSEAMQKMEVPNISP